MDFYTGGFAPADAALSYTEKSERIRSMIDLVDSVKDPLKRELMLKEIGEKLSADVKTIFKEFYRRKRSQFRTRKRDEQKLPQQSPHLTEIDRTERELGSIIVNSPDLAQPLLNAIELREIHSQHILKIIDVVTKTSAKKKRYTPADLISAIEDDNVQNIITSLAFDPHEFPKQNEDEFQERLLNVSEDIVKKLRERRKKQELDTLQEEIKKAEEQNADTTSLIIKYQDLLHSKSESSNVQ